MTPNEERLQAVLESAEEHIKAAYDVLEEAGYQMPENKNLDNLSATILEQL